MASDSQSSRETEDKLPMKRKCRSPAENQREACGVWLDTSALKKCKLQTLIGKPALRRLSLTSSYSAREKVSFPRTKQTTLSAFFGTQQAGEANTNKSLLLATANNLSDAKAPPLPAGEEPPLPSSVSLPVVMGKCRQQHVEKPAHGLPGYGPAFQAQRNSYILNFSQEEPTAKVKLPVSSDLSHPWKEKKALDYKTVSEPPLRERNDDWKREEITSSSPRGCPKRKVASSKRTKPQRSHVDPSCDSENVDPQLEGRETQTKRSESYRGPRPVLFCKASRWAADNEPEDSQGGAASSLFTQDSEGYRVISHRFLRGQGQLPLPSGPPLWGEGHSAASPALQGDDDAACYSAARGPQGSPGMTPSVSKESCYDLLFTEDSEGNKIIKH